MLGVVMCRDEQAAAAGTLKRGAKMPEESRQGEISPAAGREAGSEKGGVNGELGPADRVG